jgi:GT2 family glycosyltransferase/glycosyltransferase involved in cell wall biosynthesis
VILAACYSTAMGGAERLLVDCLGGLEGERSLACPEGALADAARAAGLRVWPLRRRSLRFRAAPATAARDLAGYALELRRLSRDLDPELLLAWSMRPLLAARLARIGVPVVFQANDLLPGRGLAELVRAAAGRAALTLTTSEAIARELDPCSRLDGRVRVMHPGVDVAAFASTAEPVDPPLVLVVGALVGWKRPDLALEACALLRRRRPELRVRFLGAPLEGHEEFVAALQARAREPDLAGAIEFAGAVEDVPRELARASCLLHCAEREPFGLAVVEALAAGRPVVAPAGGGVTEIVDQTCGRLYPPADPAGAAQALELVLADPALATRLGATGRRRARERFDGEAARRRWTREVSEVARRRSPGRTRADHGAEHVAVVTVTHNSAGSLAALLASVGRHLPEARTVVVDCASTDETLELAASGGAAQMIALADNAGFGRGCNRGIDAVREPVTLLLNPDVELLDDSLLDLVAEVRRDDRPERLLAPLVLNEDGSRQDTVHPRPLSGADLLRSVLSPSVLPVPALAPWRATGPRRVGWAVGCALVARTETLRHLGPFDERLFLYGEDLDLGLHAAATGIETWFWPSARVLHHRAHASRAAFGGEPFERLARGRREVVARRLGRRRATVDDAAQALTFGSRVAIKRLLGRPAEREQRQLRALRQTRR